MINSEDILKPPYFNLTQDKKTKLGYLTIKRIAITLRRHQFLRELFSINSMKEAFQWFDFEELYEYFDGKAGEYFQKYSEVKTPEDGELYALTDFLIWFINYNPNKFSEIMSYHLKTRALDESRITILNQVFSPAGFFYKDGFFYSSSFNSEIKVRISDFLSIKLKNIDEEIYKTWSSINEDITSNNLDKATAISSKSRKVISSTLRKLSPDLNFEKDEPEQIKKRLSKILNNEKQEAIIEKVSNLITTLNQSQSKGDHDFIDEDTAIFTFQITESILFLILSHIE